MPPPEGQRYRPFGPDSPFRRKPYRPFGPGYRTRWEGNAAPEEEQDEAGFWRAFRDSLAHSIWRGNAAMVGGAHEAWGRQWGSDAMIRQGQAMRAYGNDPEHAPPPYPSPSEALAAMEGFTDLFRAEARQTYGQSAGSGLGSTLPSMAAGFGTAKLAGAIGLAGGPITSAAAWVLGFGGGFLISNVLNTGEAYNQFLDEGVEPNSASNASIPVGIATGLIDAFPVAKFLKPLGVGSDAIGEEIKKRAIRTSVKNISKDILSGSITEGLTETAQSAVREATAYFLTGNPDVRDRVIGALEEGFAGALTGGILGGAGRTYREIRGPRKTVAEKASENLPEPSGPDDDAAKGERVIAEAEANQNVANPALDALGLPHIGQAGVLVEPDGDGGTNRRPVKIVGYDGPDGSTDPPLPPFVRVEFEDGSTDDIPLPIPEGHAIEKAPTEEQQEQQGEAADRDRYLNQLAEEVGKIPEDRQGAVLQRVAQEEKVENLKDVAPDRRAPVLKELKRLSGLAAAESKEQGKQAEQEAKAADEALKEQREETKAKVTFAEDLQDTRGIGKDLSEDELAEIEGGVVRAANEKLGLQAETIEELPGEDRDWALGILKRRVKRAQAARAEEIKAAEKEGKPVPKPKASAPSGTGIAPPEPTDAPETPQAPPEPTDAPETPQAAPEPAEEPKDAASADAEKISNETLSKLSDGDLRSPSNRDFVESFISEVVPEEERGRMVLSGDPDRNLSPEGEERIKRAILARAFPDHSFADALLNAGEEARPLRDALIEIAPRWIGMRWRLEQAGRTGTEADLSQNMADVAGLVAEKLALDADAEAQGRVPSVGYSDMFGSPTDERVQGRRGDINMGLLQMLHSADVRLRTSPDMIPKPLAVRSLNRLAHLIGTYDGKGRDPVEALISEEIDHLFHLDEEALASEAESEKAKSRRDAEIKSRQQRDEAFRDPGRLEWVPERNKSGRLKAGEGKVENWVVQGAQADIRIRAVEGIGTPEDAAKAFIAMAADGNYDPDDSETDRDVTVRVAKATGTRRPAKAKFVEITLNEREVLRELYETEEQKAQRMAAEEPATEEPKAETGLVERQTIVRFDTTDGKGHVRGEKVMAPEGRIDLPRAAWLLAGALSAEEVGMLEPTHPVEINFNQATDSYQVYPETVVEAAKAQAAGKTFEEFREELGHQEESSELVFDPDDGNAFSARKPLQERLTERDLKRAEDLVRRIVDELKANPPSGDSVASGTAWWLSVRLMNLLVKQAKVRKWASISSVWSASVGGESILLAEAAYRLVRARGGPDAVGMSSDVEIQRWKEQSGGKPVQDPERNVRQEAKAKNPRPHRLKAGVTQVALGWMRAGGRSFQDFFNWMRARFGDVWAAVRKYVPIGYRAARDHIRRIGSPDSGFAKRAKAGADEVLATIVNPAVLPEGELRERVREIIEKRKSRRELAVLRAVREHAEMVLQQGPGTDLPQPARSISKTAESGETLLGRPGEARKLVRRARVLGGLAKSARTALRKRIAEARKVERGVAKSGKDGKEPDSDAVLRSLKELRQALQDAGQEFPARLERAVQDPYSVSLKFDSWAREFYRWIFGGWPKDIDSFSIGELFEAYDDLLGSARHMHEMTVDLVVEWVEKIEANFDLTLPDSAGLIDHVIKQDGMLREVIGEIKSRKFPRTTRRELDQLVGRIRRGVEEQLSELERLEEQEDLKKARKRLEELIEMLKFRADLRSQPFLNATDWSRRHGGGHLWWGRPVIPYSRHWRSGAGVTSKRGNKRAPSEFDVGDSIAGKFKERHGDKSIASGTVEEEAEWLLKETSRGKLLRYNPPPGASDFFGDTVKAVGRRLPTFMHFAQRFLGQMQDRAWTRDEFFAYLRQDVGSDRIIAHYDKAEVEARYKNIPEYIRAKMEQDKPRWDLQGGAKRVYRDDDVLIWLSRQVALDSVYMAADAYLGLMGRFSAAINSSNGKIANLKSNITKILYVENVPADFVGRRTQYQGNYNPGFMNAAWYTSRTAIDPSTGNNVVIAHPLPAPAPGKKATDIHYHGTVDRAWFSDFAKSALFNPVLKLAALSRDHLADFIPGDSHYQDQFSETDRKLRDPANDEVLPGPLHDWVERLYTELNRHSDDKVKEDRSAPVRPFVKFGKKGPNRKGFPDRRGGRDISAKEFALRFGWRSTATGEVMHKRKLWGKSEAQWNLNWAWDAFHDLVEVLRLPSRFLASVPYEFNDMGKALGIEFGTRGRRGTSAFFLRMYDDGTGNPARLLHFNRKNGSGALVHEWGHALDHALEITRERRHAPRRTAQERGVGVARRSDFTYLLTSDIDVEKVLDLVKKAMSGQAPGTWHVRQLVTRHKGDARAIINEVIERLEKGDKDFLQLVSKRSDWGKARARMQAYYPRLQGGDPYWTQAKELFAYALESFFYDEMKGGRSEYLVNDFASEDYVTDVYPTGDERKIHAEVFRALFDKLSTKTVKVGGHNPQTNTDPSKPNPSQDFVDLQRLTRQDFDAIWEAGWKARSQAAIAALRAIDPATLDKDVGGPSYWGLHWYWSPKPQARGNQPPRMDAVGETSWRRWHSWSQPTSTSLHPRELLYCGYRRKLTEEEQQRFGVTPIWMDDPFIREWRIEITDLRANEDDRFSDRPRNARRRSRTRRGQRRGVGEGSGPHIRGVRDSDGPGDEPDDGDAGGSEGAPVSDPNYLLEGEYSEPHGDDPEAHKRWRLIKHMHIARLLADLKRENRQPTEAEKDLLFDFDGIQWGHDTAHSQIRRQYRQELLDAGVPESEVRAALGASTHQRGVGTPVAIAKAVWELLGRAGFTSGRVLDMNAGTGRFYGTMPRRMRRKLSYQAHETRSLHRRIMGWLYPDANVSEESAQDARIVKGYYDLVLADYARQIGSSNLEDMRDLGDILRKGIRSVRPGGLFVTVVPHNVTSTERHDGEGRYPSGAVLDQIKTDMSAEGDLQVARMIPVNAVNRDYVEAAPGQWAELLIYRRKRPRERFGAIGQVHQSGELRGQLRSVPDGVAAHEVSRWDPMPLTLSAEMPKHYAENPENILGRLYGEVSAAGRRLPPGETGAWTLQTDDPYTHGRVSRHSTPLGVSQEQEDHTFESRLDESLSNVPSGAYFRPGQERLGPSDPRPDPRTVVLDGTLSVGEGGEIILRTGEREETLLAGRRNRKVRRLTRSLIGLRDAVMEVLWAEQENKSGSERETLRREMERLYDEHVEQFGYVNRAARPKSRFFRQPLAKDFFLWDPNATVVLLLEKWDNRNQEASKSDAFTKDMLSLQYEPNSVRTAKEALSASLRYRQGVDLNYMADLSGLDIDSLRSELAGEIYYNPEGDQWESAEEYLSGNIREKLETARQLAPRDSRVAENIPALEAAMPEKRQPGVNLDAKLSANWIDRQTILEFAKHISSVPDTWRLSDIRSNGMLSGNSSWRDTDARQKWGTRHITGHGLMNLLIEGIPPEFGTDDMDADAIEGETREAEKALERLRVEFERWAWEDDARKKRLQEAYEKKFNSFVVPRPTGKHLVFPEMNAAFLAQGGLRSNQLRAVERILRNVATYVAHQVGTGKTFIGMVAAMKARQMGLAQKPVIVSQDNKVDEAVREMKMLYPAARILRIKVEQYASKVGGRWRVNEQRYADAINRIRQPEWDVVIMSQTSYDNLHTRPETRLNRMERDAQRYGRNSPIRRRIERQIEGLSREIRERRGWERSGKKPYVPDSLSFETTGIDMVIADEAHRWKNLPFYSLLAGRIKHLTSKDSRIAIEFDQKVAHIRSIGGKNVLMSGTPMPNSFTELYSIMRQLMPDVMEELGISKFDNWLRTFGKVERTLELTAAGTYDEVLQTTEFTNLNGLLQVAYQVIDVASAKGEGIVTTELFGGKPIPIELEKNPQLVRIFDHQTGRAIELSNPGVSMLENSAGNMARDNMLWITNDNRSASLDARMVDRNATYDENSKIGKAVELAKQVYDQTLDFKGTVLIFSDRHSSSWNPGFSIYRDLKDKLIRAGIKEEEIAIVHDIKDGADMEEFTQKVNDGEIRVVIGSSQKGGQGINIQERGSAIIHMDTDWNALGILQRNGRFDRPGNQAWTKHGWKLRIWNLVTKGSLDGFMWQKVQQKVRFSNALMDGSALNINTQSDMNQIGVTASEMVAVSTEDPRLQQLEELRRKRDDLVPRRTAWLQRVANARRAIQSIPVQLEGVRDRLRHMQEGRNMADTATSVTFDTPSAEASQPVPEDPTSGSPVLQDTAGPQRNEIQLDDPELQTLWAEHIRAMFGQISAKKGAALKIAEVGTPNGNFGVRAFIDAPQGVTQDDQGNWRTVDQRGELGRDWTPTLDHVRLRASIRGMNPTSKASNGIAGLLGQAKRLATVQSGRIDDDIQRLEFEQEQAEKDQHEEFADQDEHDRVIAEYAQLQAEMGEEQNQQAQNRQNNGNVTSSARIPIGEALDNLNNGEEAELRSTALGKKAMRKLERELQKVADRILPKGWPKVKVVEELDDYDIESGTWVEKVADYNHTLGVIQISSKARDPLRALHHEAIHALSSRFGDADWSVVMGAAQDNGWIDTYGIAERYPDLFKADGSPMHTAYEEAIAHAFEDYWRNGAASGFTGVVRRVFAAIRRLIRALAKKFMPGGALAQDRYEDVFDRVLSGEMGQRPGGLPHEEAQIRRQTILKDRSHAEWVAGGGDEALRNARPERIVQPTGKASWATRGTSVGTFANPVGGREVPFIGGPIEYRNRPTFLTDAEYDALADELMEIVRAILPLPDPASGVDGTEFRQYTQVEQDQGQGHWHKYRHFNQSSGENEPFNQPGDVNVDLFRNDIPGSPTALGHAAAEYGMIQLAGRALDLPSILHHEAIHLLRPYFTAEEYGVLEQAAKDEDWLSRHGIFRRYRHRYGLKQDIHGDLVDRPKWTKSSHPQMIPNSTALEESIAHMFQEYYQYRRDRSGSRVHRLTDEVKRIFAKMYRLLRTLARKLRIELKDRYPELTVEEVFDRVLRGEVRQNIPDKAAMDTYKAERDKLLSLRGAPGGAGLAAQGGAADAEGVQPMVSSRLPWSRRPASPDWGNRRDRTGLEPNPYGGHRLPVGKHGWMWGDQKPFRQTPVSNQTFDAIADELMGIVKQILPKGATLKKVGTGDSPPWNMSARPVGKIEVQAYQEYIRRPASGGSYAIGALGASQPAKGIVQIAGLGRNPKATLHHEVIHALGPYFTGPEIDTLHDTAKKEDWLSRYRTFERYPHLYHQDPSLPRQKWTKSSPPDRAASNAAVEESIAHAFQEYYLYRAAQAESAPKGLSGEIRRIFSKMYGIVRAFLRKLGVELKRRGPAAPDAAEEIFNRILSGDVGRNPPPRPGIRKAMDEWNDYPAYSLPATLETAELATELKPGEEIPPDANVHDPEGDYRAMRLPQEIQKHKPDSKKIFTDYWAKYGEGTPNELPYGALLEGARAEYDRQQAAYERYIKRRFIKGLVGIALGIPGAVGVVRKGLEKNTGVGKFEWGTDWLVKNQRSAQDEILVAREVMAAAGRLWGSEARGQHYVTYHPGAFWRRATGPAVGITQTATGRVKIGGASTDPVSVLYHESIHSLKHRLTRQEWAAMVETARQEGWVDYYGVRKNYPHYFRYGSGKGAPNAAAYEEAIAFAFADYFRGKHGGSRLTPQSQKNTGRFSAKDRMKFKEASVSFFEKVMAVIREIAARFGITSETNLNTLSAEDVFDRIYSGEVGSRPDPLPLGGLQPGLPSPAVMEMRVPEGAAQPLPDPAARAEELMKGNRRVARWRDGFREWGQHITRSFTRELLDLPNEGRFAKAREALRIVRAAPGMAEEQTGRHLREVMGDLTPDQQSLLTKKVFFDGFMEDFRLGLERVPVFGGDFEALKAAHKLVTQQVDADPLVRQRVKLRHTRQRELHRRMVKAGILGKETLERRYYITHQVLEYAQETIRAPSGKGLRKPRWARRRGTDLDINMNFMEAESYWMMRAIRDLQAMKMLNIIEKNYDHRPLILRAIRAQNKRFVSQRIAREARESSWKFPKGQTPRTFDEMVAYWKELPKEVYLSRWNREAFEEAHPLFQQYNHYRIRLGMFFGILQNWIEKNIKKLPKDMPKEVKDGLELLGDFVEERHRDKIQPWAAIAWLADRNNPAVPDEISGSAAGIFMTITARRTFSKSIVGARWILHQNMDTALRRLRRAKAPELNDPKENFYGDEFETFQADEGNILFSAYTVPERIARLLPERLEEIVMSIDPEAKVVAKDFLLDIKASLRNQTVMAGPKKQMVLPAQLAHALKAFRDEEFDRDIGWIEQFMTKVWKKWVLLNPASVAKYWTRNLSGDFDHVLAAIGLKGVRNLHLLERTKELWEMQIKGGDTSERYDKAIELGVLDSGWVMAEVVGQHEQIEAALGSSTPKKLWAGLVKFNNFRENILRWALYNYVADHVEEYANLGKPPNERTPPQPELILAALEKIGLGAVRRSDIQNLEDWDHVIAQYTRDTVGDYMTVTHGGKKLSRYLMPFFRWKEVNFKFYKRLGSNIVWQLRGSGYKDWRKEQGVSDKVASAAGRAALAAGKQAAVYTLYSAFLWSFMHYLWNNMLFGDDEDELSDQDRRRQRLIVGKWNENILLLDSPGALMDNFSWIGLEDAGAMLNYWARGRGTLGDAFRAMAEGFPNTIAQGATPLIKLPAELLAGKESFPDVFNMRQIKSNYYHALRGMALDKYVDFAGAIGGFGRPTQGVWRPIVGSFLTMRHPDSMAYNNIRAHAFQFKSMISDTTGAPEMTDRMRAYHYYRQARRFGDERAEKAYDEELRKLGVTHKQKVAMIDRQHPLGMFTRAEKFRFMATLNDEEKRNLNRAVKYWRDVYKSGRP